MEGEHKGFNTTPSLNGIIQVSPKQIKIDYSKTTSGKKRLRGIWGSLFEGLFSREMLKVEVDYTPALVRECELLYNNASWSA